MRSLILLIFLASCANIKDNTTLSDKAIIGGFIATQIIIASKAGLL
jgi:hypothetical protein